MSIWSLRATWQRWRTWRRERRLPDLEIIASKYEALASVTAVNRPAWTWLKAFIDNREGFMEGSEVWVSDEGLRTLRQAAAQANLKLTDVYHLRSDFGSDHLRSDFDDFGDDEPADRPLWTWTP